MSKLTLEPKCPSIAHGFLAGGPLNQILSSTHSGFTTPILNQPADTIDRFWMLEAFTESLNGVGLTNPNPAVGCVIVDQFGKEVSRGCTEAYPGRHAEAVAFQKVADLKRLENASLYVTLEPCSHQGKQPPCVNFLLNSKIKHIFIARKDSNPLVNGKGIRKLQRAGKEVHIGLFGAEVTAWNFPFFAEQALKRPVIILKWAQTLDGQLADDTDQSQWISGPQARAYTHWLRQKYDVVLVGAKTFLRDTPRLTVRDCALPHHRSPLPIVFDPKGLCLSKKITQLDPRRKWLLITTPKALTLKKNKMNPPLHKGFTLLTIPGKNPAVELMELFSSNEMKSHLGRPLQSVFIEGGAKTLSLFILSGFVDFFHVFTAPTLTAGVKNRIRLLFPLKKAKRLELISTAQLGSDVVMEMAPKKITQTLFSF